MVTYLNANDDQLFFIGLNREEYLNSLTGETDAQVSPGLYTMDFATGEIKQLVTGEVQIFNVLDNDVIIYISTQGMCRVKADGTGFEQLLIETPSDDSASASDESTDTQSSEAENNAAQDEASAGE